MRLAAQNADLLRNAVARRDALLAEQRSAYYKELLQHKSERQALANPPPAQTYEKALEGPPVEERPCFFDACVFEACHLAIDTPLADKATRALEQANEQKAKAGAQAGVEVARIKEQLESERKSWEKKEEEYKKKVCVASSTQQQQHAPNLGLGSKAPERVPSRSGPSLPAHWGTPRDLIHQL